MHLQLPPRKQGPLHRSGNLHYLAPPIYSAAAYNLVGRLMNYLPMHAVLNPNRVLIFFVYVGAVVEAITAAGAAKNAAAGSDIDKYKCGGEVIAAGLVLQAVVECLVCWHRGHGARPRYASPHGPTKRANALYHAVRHIDPCPATLCLLRCRSVRNV